MINPTYLNPPAHGKIKQEFHSNQDFPSVVLFKFLEREAYLKLREQILRLYYQKELVRTSHSYAVAELPLSITRSFHQEEFLGFLSSILNTTIKRIDLKAYSFSWKDYTLLSDAAVEEPGIDLIFDLTPDWDEKAKGYIFYKDGEGNFISLPIAADMLALVGRIAGVQRYVQYVNHHAEKKRRLLVMGKMMV